MPKPSSQQTSAILSAAQRSRRTRFASRIPASFTRIAALLLCIVALLGASQPTGNFNKVGHEMMCVCGCGQILLECNHVGCPDSDRMIGELRTQVASGGTDTSIMNWFAAKYGPTVLAAPVRGGFDTVAWIAPAVVFFFATIGTALVIRAWKSKRKPGTPVAIHHSPEADALRERIRRETEY